jgi:hypothetical protein
MKTKKKQKVSKQVRVSLKHYEQLRRAAYRAHKPMAAILEEIIAQRAVSTN